jgi:GT2 family glycosyltransferase
LPVPTWYSERLRGALGISDIGEKEFIAGPEYKGNVGIGANMAFKRETFDRVGLFRTDLGRMGNKLLMGEDTEIYRRIKGRGEKCLYSPEAWIYHCVDEGKMRKSHFRRWFFRMGQRMSESDSRKADGNCRSKRGVPLWRYRKAIEDTFGFFWFMMRRNAAEAYFREVCLLEFLGYFFQMLRQGKLKKEGVGSVRAADGK